MVLDPPLTLSGPYRLEALSMADWELEQRLSRDPDVVRWTYYPADLDEAGARARIDATLQRAAQGLARRYAIRDDHGVPLGTCGLGRLREVPEVFYAVLAAHRGRGVATAAVMTLTDWALSRTPVVALETVALNVASERVAQKAGFAVASVFEGDHRGGRAQIKRWLAFAAERGDAPR